MSESGCSRALSLLGAALVVVLTLASGALAQSDEIAIGPLPEWVDPVVLAAPFADLPDEDVAGGVYYLLSDRQVNRISDPPAMFMHTAWMVQNNVGVQDGSQISIDFDPTYQAVTFHFVRIHRDGEVLDRLEREQIRIIQPERRLEQQIYDGSLTALIVLEDVRQGDVIEYAYSRAGASPVLAGHFSDSAPLGFSVPIGRVRYRLLWPGEGPPSIRKVNTDVTAVVEKIDGGTSYEWSVRQPPALDPVYDTPAWHDPYPWIQLTDFQSWNEVAAWGDSLFATANELSPEVTAEVDRIATEHADTEARVLAALRFVQDEIRYFAISLGSGSYQPSEPGVVLDRRFGDCKDKSSLLVGMLRALDVEADVAFVGTGVRHTVSDWLPSVAPFDHVIVRVMHEGQPYWIDPTDSQARGPLAGTQLPEYGRALVIAPDTTGLTAVTPGHEATALRGIVATFRAEIAGAPVRMNVETTYHGSEADGLRYMLEHLDREEYTRNARDYYAGMYPSIESLETIGVADDETANVIVTTESYMIPEFWTFDEARAAYDAEFYPLEIANVLSVPARSVREYPLAVPHPIDIYYRTRVHLSDDSQFAPERVTLTNDGFAFDHQVNWTPGVLRIDYTLRSKAGHVSPEGAVQYAADVEKLQDHLSFVIEHGEGWTLAALLPMGIGAALGLLFVIALLVVVLVYRRFGRSIDAPVAPAGLGVARGLLRAVFTIWFEPRATIRRVHSVDTTLQVILIIMVAGVFSAWDQASLRNLGDRLPMPAILIAGALVGPVLSLIRFYIVTYALTWIGQWLGGHANARQVRTAVGYGNLIYLWLSLTWIPLLLLMREECFTTDAPRLGASVLLQALSGVVAGLAGGLIVWQCVVVLKALSEVNGFSVWRALLVAFVTLVLVVVAIVLLVAMLVLPFVLASSSGL